MKNKKLFAILTLVCFLFTMMPVAVFANEESGSVESPSESIPAPVTTAGELKLALESATTGAVITLSENITASEIITINKAITLDGNGKTLTSTAGRAINVSGANGVTIKNLTIEASGERAINIIQNADNVTINTVTASAANYTVNIASSAPNATVTIENSTLNGLCTVNVAAAGAEVKVENSTVNCNDNNTTEGESYAALSLNKEAIGGSIIATGCTINVVQGSDSVEGRNGAENGTVTINGSTENVLVTVAAIIYGVSPYYHGFPSLASAVEFAKAGDTITLIRNIELLETITIPCDVMLNANEKTITLNNGGSFTVTDNTSNVEIVPVAASGYTLVQTTNTTESTITYTVTPITYTVTFDSDGGSAVVDATVNHGDKVSKPANPSKSGYSFAGWFKDGVAFDFNTAITTDTALKAKWDYIYVYIPDIDYSDSSSSSTPSTPSVETETIVTPSGTVVETTTETKADGTVTETTTTTTASGETTKVETTIETTKEGTIVETTVTTKANGETTTSVTATLESGSAVTNTDATVDVAVTAVAEKVVTQATEALANDSNVTVVGNTENAVSVAATNATTGVAQNNLAQPMSVSVPVNNATLKNITDTTKLTLAKVVTNADGTTELVYMGGSFDANSGTFTASVDESGDYILVEKEDLVKIELNIGQTAVKENDRVASLDVAPKINAEAGRTELPLRYLGEALGFGIEWNNNVVTITKDGNSFAVNIGEEIPGFGKPYVENGRTMISARYISEMLGANVIWDPAAQKVVVVK